jgi:hypothetical protein
MPGRDPEIQRIFEITDDAFHGLLGFHLFTDAAVSSAPDTTIRIALPRDQIWITPDWNRFYDREELLFLMRRWFSPIFFRNLLVALVSYFDATTEDMLTYLLEKKIDCGFLESNMNYYKQRLAWVFEKVKDSIFKETLSRSDIAKICLNADHCRRLRNIIAHNQGCINNRYENDFIRVDTIFGDSSLTPQYDPAIDQFRVNRNSRVPVIISYDAYYTALRNHIRLLHFLHNEIQFQYFGHPTGYSYKEEGKRIEWQRVFFGT